MFFIVNNRIQGSITTARICVQESDGIMNKKISLGLCISLIAIASAVTFILTSFYSLKSFNKKVVDVNEKAQKYNSLQMLDSYVRDHYYGDIDENELNDGILKGYIDGLDDPYSRYLSDDEYMDEKGRFDLTATGIIAYSHGEYYALGKKLGKFGYSVEKKRK